MGEERPQVLVVAHDDSSRKTIVRMLTSLGHAAIAAADGQQALQLLASQPVAIALIDLKLPGVHGFDVLRSVKAMRPAVECVVLTDAGGARAGLDARAHGASDFLEKPIADAARVEQVIQRAFEVWHLRKTIAVLEPARTSPIVGVSIAIQSTYGLVQRLAGSSSAVLVTGEPGVGKGLVAEAFHEHSHATGRFVRINCAAFPEALIGAELFGVDAASGGREGLLAQAANGTLFLDDIGEMPLAVQAKLALALETRTWRPVGGGKDHDFTANVIAATNVDLQRALKTGTFREDLYARLSALTVAVPPLRNRKEDIPILLRYFLRKYSATEGRGMPHLPEAVLDKLVSYPWPGNVRELATGAERAVTVAHGRSVRIDDLGLANPSVRVANAPSDDLDDPKWNPYLEVPLSEAKAIVDREFVTAYLRDKLRKTAGNISRAAVLAGVLRPNFKREMRRFGVQAGDGDDT